MPPDPSVDAGAIPQRQFSSARRGFDPAEVRAYLHQLAETIAALQREEERERARAEEAERRADRAEKPDHNFLVEMLGEETARVLDAAREAARDIREKAEAAAERLISQANEEAHERRAEGEAQVLALRNKMLAEIDELRQQAAGELERRRAEADQLVAEMRREAELAADGVRQQGEKERAAAVADAEDLRAAAREEGRRLIVEAQTMRERVLGDLNRRRRAAREQLERLNAARGRLLAAYEVVRRTADEATAELNTALPEAKVAGDTAMWRVRNEPELTVDDLESHVSLARVAGLLPPLPQLENRDLDEIIDEAGGLGPAEDDEAPTTIHAVPSRELSPGASPASAPERSNGAEEARAAEVVVDAVGDPAVGFERSEPGDQIAETDATSTGTEPVEVAPADVATPEVATSEVATTEVVKPSVDDVFARLKGEEVAPPADGVLLRQRDETLEPLERAMSRRLKRVLADEQNEVLDLVRRGKAGEAGEDLLPDPEDHVGRYARASADELHTAAYWGAAAAGGHPAGSCDGLARQLGEHLADPLRERLERSVADADGDADELTDRLRALYREVKNQRVGEAVKHFVAAAYSQGTYDAVPEGGRLRWVVDPSGVSCPDAEDNALAGPVRKGDPFPTGHCSPPAHPGCRCMTMVVAGNR